MALLDRFRTQTRQKHADPAVRLAFVQEIPIDERDLLAEIARDDTDARVRRAAVAKLMDTAALAVVAKDDADEGVRAQAVTMLRDIALEAFEGLGETESFAAIDALTTLPDARTLAGIAKSGTRESVAQRALAGVSDVHLVGSIARHAGHESVRGAAFAALQDESEILGVALNSEFKDPTLAAVERLTGRDDLEQVAARAKNKSAAKRARALVREMDDRAAQQAAEAAAAAAPKAPPAPEPDPAERERVERETAERQAAAERARIEEAERARAAEDAAAQRREEQAAADRASAQAKEEAARREAERRHGRLTELVAEFESASADADVTGARRRIGVARREWKDLMAVITIDPELATRVAAAETAFAARDAAAHEQDLVSRREALTRIQHLVGRVEALIERPQLTLKAGERALRDIRTTLGAVPPLPSKKDYEDVMQRLKAAQSALTPKVQELRDLADWQRWANVGIQEQLCEKMEALKAVEDPEEIARHVRDLQQQWRQAADVPRAQGEALWRRFKAAHDEVWAKCEAHFAAQAGVRAENLARKVALCERAEALAESTNWIQTADEIKGLQAEWKTIGPVSRGQEKAIWDRFRSACDRFFTRRHTDLAQRKATWSENLTKKEALCVRAEALADSTEWDAAAAEIKQLQVQWKSIGPVKKTRSDAIWQRFRTACDAFFNRFAQRHDIARGERLASREQIVGEMEELAGLTPVVSQEAAVDSREAVVDSRESVVAGPESVVGSRESVIDSPEDSPESIVDRPESMVDGAEPAVASPEPAVAKTELPVVSPASSLEPPADLLARVRSLRGKWQHELALRGVDRERAAALDARFAAAFNGVIARWPAVFNGTDLDPDANRKRMESLVRRMEELATSLAGPAASGGDGSLSPTDRLAAMLKEALAANTIGGKVDDDARFRAATEEARQAQATWSRIGFVPDEARNPLVDRFQRALRRINEKAGAAGGPGGAGRSGGPGPSRPTRPTGS